MVANILRTLLRIYLLLRQTAESVLSWLTSDIQWPEWMGGIEEWFPSGSPLELMFGAGLVGLLIFIIVKFYTDLVL